MSAAVLDSADTGTGNCGTPGSSCGPFPDCPSFVKNGYGMGYWVMRTLSSFQDHLNAATTALTIDEIGKTLNISTLIADFSEDASYTPTQNLALIIGAAFFLIGGVANLVTLGAGLVAEGVTGSISVCSCSNEG